MKIQKMDVLAFTLTEVERLDPVRVMIENYEPGKGRITITCHGKAWTGAWFAMGGDSVQDFIKRVSNEYLIGYFDPQLQSTVDDDNDANLAFVKGEIIKLRRREEVDGSEARAVIYAPRSTHFVMVDSWLSVRTLLQIFAPFPLPITLSLSSYSIRRISSASAITHGWVKSTGDSTKKHGEKICVPALLKHSGCCGHTAFSSSNGTKRRYQSAKFWLLLMRNQSSDRERASQTKPIG